jgi:cell fate (sporulation/competence/biofilm development) regulator YlbF (YheA/YmcA/DUF963 family)
MTSRILAVLLLLPILGCGEEMKSEVNENVMARDASGKVTQGVNPPGLLARAGTKSPASPAQFAEAAADFGREKRDQVPILDPVAADPAKAVARKILYSADVDIIVEDFARTTDSLTALVKRVGGYVADSNVSGSPGSNRQAIWKVRVPVAKFEEFLDAAVKLGELQNKGLHSQDVTEEFFDLETRIKNKKVEEDRLVKHLTESTGKLTDILAVEREISRVREEVERMEGRIRLLANLADLTTVSLTVHERLGFIPPTSPTFATRAERTFSGSFTHLVNWLQYVVLLAISIIPWLPLWFVVTAVAWLIFRRRRRLAARPSSASTAP